MTVLLLMLGMVLSALELNPSAVITVVAAIYALCWDACFFLSRR